MRGSKFLKSSSVKEYYISPSGNDKNPGSDKKPWKTLERLNKVNLNPGDKVLLEGGKVFQGSLLLDSLDRGKKDNNIIISSFGSGRATIDGGNAEGIKTDRCEYFAIKCLTIKGNGRKAGNLTNGILISDSKYFDLDSLEVFGFQHSGVHVHIAREAKISNIYAHDNGFAGIHVTGATMNDPAKYDNENIYIGYCIAENNPGDPTVTKNHSGNGILASAVRHGIIEYCEAFNNGWDMPWTGNGPVGIWIWDCTDFVIQYCISHGNKTNPKAGDGGGFDLDGGVSNSIIQYCLSYNNLGAGIGLFEFGAVKPWENNVIRYNISQNDGIINGGSLAIWKSETSGLMKNCEIYNNTFYNDTARGVALWVSNNCPGFNFRNNIFIYKGPFLYPGQKLATELFQDNCYWNLSGDQPIAGFRSLVEWSKVTGNEILGNSLLGKYSDPCLFHPGNLTLTDPTRIREENLAGYCLKPGSSIIDQGLDLRKLFNIEVVTKDIIGTRLPQGNGYDIGAVEYIMK